MFSCVPVIGGVTALMKLSGVVYGTIDGILLTATEPETAEVPATVTDGVPLIATVPETFDVPVTVTDGVPEIETLGVPVIETVPFTAAIPVTLTDGVPLMATVGVPVIETDPPIAAVPETTTRPIDAVPLFSVTGTGVPPGAPCIEMTARDGDPADPQTEDPFGATRCAHGACTPLPMSIVATQVPVPCET